MTHTILSLGYDGGPEFPTLEKAKSALTEIVNEALEACRKRFGKATKIKIGENSYKILIGDKHSVSVWSTHTILKL
jgi:hypothetical protein